MKKLGIIAFLIMAFTTVTTLTMPNPAQQSPAKFDSYDQMMRYFKGLKKHGLEHEIAVIWIEGTEMFFIRDGERCRM
ncbi:MAG: hypothetical protein NTV58_02805 [Deltaproteobacteria bacterium]|nr:hypothetical protein [Deltaproteobacteria bacterium]